MICGVDEAGKGSVLGPLVVAGIGISSEERLADLGVKDSKQLVPKERERLYREIRKRCKVATVTIDAQKIDAIRVEMTMNACVARAHARVITMLAPSCAYVDACDVNCFRYAEMVKVHLEPPCEIVSEHHADEKFAVVSAASIVAKVVRDREIAKLAKIYGEIGSGYPSDPVTIRWLSGYIGEHPRPPPIARRSWKTVSALLAKKSQSSLYDF
ncbi:MULTISPECIES: ribonuclease HII [unclassified Methanoregula]|uniref:ribonuclease HII n=1 Tax=unclassified Methanoregula TaxID=2649730 RepID=UPI0009C7ADB5|nr:MULTISPECIES: ribonuclease HII [unclassified Methanoregula]OPX64683.1 MAG: Ribonuclease HII [Methanoregula sp. PtaB.Bin085]OPY36051.1 MAG: Ribonuclease HII [Methanoregula sp. PtaU1.Bin006]